MPRPFRFPLAWLSCLALILGGLSPQALASKPTEPETVVHDLFQDLRLGRAMSLELALAPGVAPPRGAPSWHEALARLSGAKLTQLDAFRPAYWEPCDREYAIQFTTPNGASQTWYLGLRLEGAGTWQVMSLGPTAGPRMAAQPTTLKPAVPVRVHGTGFPAGKRLDLTMETEGVGSYLLAQISADPHGEATFQVQLPAVVKGIPILTSRVTLHLGTPGNMASRAYDFVPALYPRDLGGLYQGKGFVMSYPAGYWRKTLADGVSWVDPTRGGEVIRLREMNLPQNAEGLDPEEFAQNFGPLLVDGAGAIARFDHYYLADGNSAWAASWKSDESLLPPNLKGINLPPVLGPYYLIPKDRMGDTWVVLESSASFLPVLDAVARSVMLQR